MNSVHFIHDFCELSSELSSYERSSCHACLCQSAINASILNIQILLKYMYICYCIHSSYLYTLKMMVVGYILWCTYTELDCSLQDPTCYMTENTCNDTSIMFFNIHQSIRTHIPAKKKHACTLYRHHISRQPSNDFCLQAGIYYSIHKARFSDHIKGKKNSRNSKKIMMQE